MPDHASRGEVLIHNCAWDIDPDRSRIEFRARSVWGLLPVAGRFRDSGATLSVGETGALAGMLTINAASVDTPTGSATPTFGANNSSASRGNRRSLSAAPNVAPTVHNSRVRRRSVRAGRPSPFPIGGIFDCRGEQMTLHSETVLRLSDFGIWVPVGFIRDQLRINADITLRPQR